MNYIQNTHILGKMCLCKSLCISKAFSRLHLPVTSPLVQGDSKEGTRDPTLFQYCVLTACCKMVDFGNPC